MLFCLQGQAPGAQLCMHIALLKGQELPKGLAIMGWWRSVRGSKKSGGGQFKHRGADEFPHATVCDGEGKEWPWSS